MHLPVFLNCAIFSISLQKLETFNPEVKLVTSDSLNPHTVLFEDSDNGIMIERVIDHVKSESESDQLDGVMRLPDNTSDFEVCDRF